MTDEYPDLPDHPAKAWEYAPLHMCSSRRMQQIGKDFGLTGISSLVKKELFETIYNHMFQMDVCATCEGTCRPTDHLFPPLQDKPTTPDTSPNSRNTRQNMANNSPSRMAALADDSGDQFLGEIDSELFPGQNQVATNSSAAASLADRISQGAVTEEAIDFEAALAKDAEITKLAIEKRSEEEKKRRAAELAKARKPEETPQQILARRIKEQRAAMKAAANKQFQIDEAAHSRAVEAEKAKNARVPPARRNSEPSVTSKRKRSTSRHVGFVPDAMYADSTPESSPEKLSSDDEDDAAAGPFTTRGLVKYMSQSFAKALDQHERKSARRVSIHDADINCVNGVPHGAPSSGKMALKPVPNTTMAARLGLAPSPNLHIEGDPSNLDFKKIHKHMQSGSKRSLGQFVSRQVNWPEEYLSNNAPGKGKTEFSNLTFVEFIDGMLAKCMLETPADQMDNELCNKLQFLRELVAMHYSMGIKDVLAVTERFLRGWESKNFEWDDWTKIEVFLRESKYQQICTALTANNFSRRNGGGGGAGGGGANGGGGGAANSPKGNSNVHGIPTEFLRSKKLCIKYNLEECPEKADHVQPHNKSGVILFHKCAGCAQKGVTPEKEHSVKSCPKGPYKTPFRA